LLPAEGAEDEGKQGAILRAFFVLGIFFGERERF
jgi:hypothetical protein